MRLPDLTEIGRERKKMGLTQTELADKAKVSQSLIARLEAGSVDPRYSKVALVFNALESLKGREIEAHEISTSDVVGIQKSSSLEFAASKMGEYGVSQMPVFDNDAIVGSFSEKVILDLLSKGFDAKTFSSSEVAEHMEEAFPTVKPETPLSVVSSLLEHNGAVLVYQQGKAVGIITKADLLKVVKK